MERINSTKIGSRSESDGFVSAAQQTAEPWLLLHPLISLKTNMN
jgi:hypothetical protein